MILVVDDDDDIREILTTILSQHGHHVLTAANGDEALALLAAGERPAMILLDLMMPNMSGEEFRARQLADQELALIPVVVLSGAGGVGEISERLGVEVIPKPIELSLLLATVERFGSRSG